MKQIVGIVRQNFIMVSIIKMLLLFILCSVLNYIINNIVKFLYRKSRSSRYVWDDILVITVRKPVVFLMWIYGVLFCFNIVQKKIGYNLYDVLCKLKSIAIIYCISMFVTSFVNRYCKKVVHGKRKREEKIDYGLIEFFRKVVLITSLTIVTIIGLKLAGIDIKGLVALGGIGGIAIGFASRDLLSNLFGGLSIFLDKPFTVGDWISSPDKRIEGIVESIGWRETKIMSFSNYPIYLPNFIFSGIIIENKGRMKSRLIEEVFPVKFVDYNKIKNVTKEIRIMLEENCFIDSSSSKIINLSKIGNNTLEITLYTFSNVTSYENYLMVKEDILLSILKIFDRNNIQLEKRIVINSQNPNS